MKFNSKYISLIVLSFILVLVAGISFLSIEKSDVEEVYAAAPDGYVKITPNTLYENVEYYIDTSYSVVDVSYITSNISTYPYLGGIVSSSGAYCNVIKYGSSSNNWTLICNTSNNIWNSNIINGIISSYPTLNINLTTSPDWLYVKQSAPSPVTQSLPITFDSGVSSVSLGNQTWSSSGATNSVTFDDEDNTYTFNVTLNNAVLRSVTYNLSSDTTVGGILNATISGSSFTCECPVGDSIESITIYTDSLIYTYPCVVQFDEHIEKVVYGDIEWTESGQSNDIEYNLTDGSMTITFDVYLDFGYVLSSSSRAVYTNGTMTTSIDGSAFVVSGINAPNARVDTVYLYTEVYNFQNMILQQYFPYFSGGTNQGFNVDGYNSLGSLSVLGGTVFNSQDEVLAYFNENYTGEKPAGSIISVLDNSGNPVSYPLVADGQFIQLRYSTVISDVAFVVDNDWFIPNYLGFAPCSTDVLNSIDTNINWLSIPQFIYQNSSGYFYFTSVDGSGSSVDGEGAIKTITLQFPSTSIVVDVEVVDESLSAADRALYRFSTENIPSGYYLNLITFYNPQSSQVVFHFSNTPGGIGWNPDFDDALAFLANLFDGVLDILDSHITPTITIGTILMAVLALGVLLFIFRVSGVF